LLFWWGVSGPVRPDFVVQRADIRPFQTGSKGLLVIIEIEHDQLDTSVARIPKGQSGRARE